MSKKVTLISVDVETTGPCPGGYDMIDLGACVIGVEPSSHTFSVALKPVYHEWWPGHRKFWDKFPQVLAKIESQAIAPYVAMRKFRIWLSQFENPRLVGFPISVDFQYINWYWHHFLQVNPPFTHRGICGRSYAAGVLGLADQDLEGGTMKSRLAAALGKCPFPNTHRALDDAREQAWMFERVTEIQKRNTCGVTEGKVTYD